MVGHLNKKNDCVNVLFISLLLLLLFMFIYESD